MVNSVGGDGYAKASQDSGELGDDHQTGWSGVNRKEPSSSNSACSSSATETVARRKSAAKDSKAQFVGIEVPSTTPISLWRTWTFCLVLGCVFTISTILWGQMSDGPTSTTRVTVNFQQLSRLPAVSSEDLEIPLPDPIRSIYVQDAVVFPDNVMLLVKVSEALDLEGNIDSLECRFGGELKVSTTPVLSIKPRTKDLQMVRCSRPDKKDFPAKTHGSVTLGIRESDVRVQSNALYRPDRLPTWEALVYENLIDSDSLVLLAKGLATKSSKRIDTTSLACVFGKHLPSEVLCETRVLTAVQEVIRCEKPPADMEDKLRGVRVSVRASWLGVLPSVTYYNPNNTPRNFLNSFLSRDFSVAAPEESRAPVDLDDLDHEEAGGIAQKVDLESNRHINREISSLGKGPIFAPVLKRKLCACTMVWNKAPFIREWVIFHSYMGVEKYFVYDNDSDDDTDEVLDSLAAYNISRMVWPWIKTQQAAFSHCTILARDECEWMMFSDVDEYIYPYYYLVKPTAPSSSSDAMVLHRLIDTESGRVDRKSGALGEIQFDCHNFGPSGLDRTPQQGVTVGYTCRMRNPERHKSIVKLAAVNTSLLNVLHHFELHRGYQSVKLLRKTAVVNHYKFQAWDAFKMKFVRRAGTYTTDWKKSENRGSKDRTPGLGTEAVKPGDWESRFCEVKDTGLRDFALRTFALPGEPDRLEWQLNSRPEDER